MASEVNETELEDGEINELEDGEIEDDESPFPAQEIQKVSKQTNPKFSSFAEPPSTRGGKGRNFPFQGPQMLWRREEIPLQRPLQEDGWFRDHGNVNSRMRLRPLLQLQGPIVERGSHVQGNLNRAQKTLPRKRGNGQKTSPPNPLPVPPRLVPPSPRKEKEQISEPSDDFDLLLERHKLIQQQLEALEKQEQAALEEELIDDSFVDIPVEDLKDDEDEARATSLKSEMDRKLNLEGDGNSGIDFYNRTEEYDNAIIDSSNKLISKSDNLVPSIDTGSDNVTEEVPVQKLFFPFKIKSLYRPVPSLKELSSKGDANVDGESLDDSKPKSDEVPHGNWSTDAKVGDNNVVAPIGVQRKNYKRRNFKPNVQRNFQPNVNVKRKRKRARKRKQRENRMNNNINNQKTNVRNINQAIPVDAHTELEARLLSLAGTPLDEVNTAAKLGMRGRVDVENTQKKRREKLKQWQQTHGQDSRPTGRELRSGSHEKGPSPGRRKGPETKSYELDDYLEAPMDVESDTTEGPVLPLIEETGDDLPPPPPPLPAEIEVQKLQNQQHSMVYSVYPHQSLAPQMQLPPNIYGFYPPGQIMYNDCPTGYVPSHHGQEQLLPDYDFRFDSGNDRESVIQSQELGFEEQQGPLGPADSGDQDDEAAMLREILLKSVAKKRAAKSTNNTDGKAASALASPRQLRLQVTARKDPPSRTVSTKPRQPTKTVRKVTVVAPPKHERVVIQLGQDSDDSDDSEVEDGRPLNSRGGGGDGGFFGSLDILIKQTRKSVEASKFKPNPTSEQAELSSAPKTPDALQHLPEERKAEYRRLKERLAQHEGKRSRLPLSDVNQDKEMKSDIDTGEKKMEDIEESSELPLLKEEVVSCEQKLRAQRKFLESDQSLLSKLTTVLTKKTSLLEVHGEMVNKLKKQLEAAQKAAMENRLMVKRLHEKAKAVKERVTKKLVMVSDVEEELLRARSLVSAARRNPGMYSGMEIAALKGSMESDSGNENQAIAGLTSVQLRKKQLNSLQKAVGSAKRNFAGDSGTMTSEMNVKRAKLDSPKSSPLQRKQIIAERIALEKVRLKKLEQELAEKLRKYNNKSSDSDQICDSNDSEVNQTSLSSDLSKKSNTNQKQGTRTVSAVQREERQRETKETSDERTKTESAMESSVTGVTGNATSQGHKPLAMETEDESSSNEMAASGASIMARVVETAEVSIDEKKLQYVRKLQEEKEKKGPTFPTIALEIPQPVHKKAALCIWLTTGDSSIMSSAPRKGPTDAFDWIRIPEKQNQKEHDGDEQEAEKPVALPYKSVLLYLKSYRLSPFFRTKAGFSLSSLSFSNKIKPRTPFCNYDLNGVCNDEECPYQHTADYKLDENETMVDLAAYVTEDKENKQETNSLEEKMFTLVESFTKQYQGKISWDQLYVLLVNRVQYIRKKGAPYNVSATARLAELKQTRKRRDAPEEPGMADRGRGVMNIKQGDPQMKCKKSAMEGGPGRHHKEEECQEIRYFSEAYNSIDTLVAAVKELPTDVALWIKLAHLRLNQKLEQGKNVENRESGKVNLMQALDTLSRGLEANSNSEELWLEYLQLFILQGSSAEQQELCEQALDFVPTYSIWWHYLNSTKTYKEKRSVCLRLISHLLKESIEFNSVDEVWSHRLLESVLYLVQIELYSGHFKDALAVLQAVLGKRKPTQENDVPKLITHLKPSDLCLTWLAYIHVFEFHHLPQAWFDPKHSFPAKMVAKDVFVFPWQPGNGTRASSEKLLGMFHDALRACTVRVKSASEKMALCLPLYQNLLALERAHGRVDSAKGICRRLLQGTPREVELWLCLAALEESTNNPQHAAEVYGEALKKSCCHAVVAYGAARFQLEQGDPSQAVQTLLESVYVKFTDTSNEVDPLSSLLGSVVDGERPDPIVLYRKLLSQPLPYDCKYPPLMPGIDVKALGKEEVYLWLGYCLLLELSPSISPLCQKYSLSADSAYETAVHTIMNRKDAQTVWLEYLFYKKAKVLSDDGTSVEGLKALDDLVNRCLVSVSTSCSLPYSSSSVWQDYSFHNQVINLYLSCFPQDHRSLLYSKYLKWFPNNLHLALRACEHEASVGNAEQAKKIAAVFLADNPSCIIMWKILTSLELQRNHINEARKMYQQATDVLPFAATLWKDYVMFEVVRNEDKGVVSNILKKCRDIGVDIEDYLNTLLGQ